MITFETYKPCSKTYTNKYQKNIKSMMDPIRDYIKDGLLDVLNYKCFECFNLNADTLMLSISEHVNLGFVTHQFVIIANWYKETVIIKYTNTDNMNVDEVTAPFDDPLVAPEEVRDYFVQKLAK